jgi:pathogenesis-related protein 1
MWKLLILPILLLSASTVSITKVIDQESVLLQHNTYRKELNIAPLQFSQECADFAQQWAEKLAKRNRGLVHSTKNKFGENIYWNSAPSNETEMVEAWATEKHFFSTRKRKSNSKNGHYTQMIWETTKFVGTGMAISKDGSEYWVCTYYPPGNWAGEKAYK